MNSQPETPPVSPSEEQAAEWCMRIAERPLYFAEQAEFEQWIASSDENERNFDQMVSVWHYTDAIAELPGFLSLRAKALTAMEQAQTATEPTSRRAFAGWRMWAMAASMAIVALIGAWNWSNSPDVYATSVGERRHIQLADGSRISLDASSQISVSFGDERRAIHLDRGRAKFDVAKDPLRPFTVVAGSQAVVAVGTSFSVELLKDQLRVHLFEGEVAVLPQRAASRAAQPAKKTEASTQLKPGQELVAALSTGAAKITAANMDRSQSWEEGRIDFIDTPLSQAVERVNRYARIPVIVEDPAAGRKLVNGVFDAGDTESFVTGVTELHGLKSSKDEKKITIVSVN